jgi:hypothetical protein
MKLMCAKLNETLWCWNFFFLLEFVVAVGGA